MIDVPSSFGFEAFVLLKQVAKKQQNVSRLDNASNYKCLIAFVALLAKVHRVLTEQSVLQLVSSKRFDASVKTIATSLGAA